MSSDTPAPPQPPEPTGLDAHFEGKLPKIRGLFRGLMRLAQRGGGVTIDVNPVRIALFAPGPVLRLAVRRTHLRVQLLLPYPCESPRFDEIERAGRNFLHHLRLSRHRDLDDELARWIADSVAAARHERPEPRERRPPVRPRREDRPRR